MKLKLCIAGLLVLMLAALITVVFKINNQPPSKNKTVNSTLRDLEKRRGNEIHQIFGDLSTVKAIKLIAIKQDKVLEVWINRNDTFVKTKNYPFTSFSGALGPKRRFLDGQIPEGFYKIEGLNPNSKHHLSLKINYPNDFDKEIAIKEERTELGGQIFIHGKSITIGCIPLGDIAIEELFYLVGTVGKSKTDIIISPIDYRKPENIQKTFQEYDTLQNYTTLYQQIKKSLQEFQ